MIHEPPWLTIARGEIGVTEIPGKEHNPRIVEYHQYTAYRATSDEVPWCAAFACWCLEKVHITSPRSARARDFLNWGSDVEPPPCGAVVVLRRGEGPGSADAGVIDAPGHVGFVTGYLDTLLLVLGGNQRNRVEIQSFAKNRVLGYRWPSSTEAFK